MHVPVSKQHRHIHSTEDEDDMEPGILKDVTRGRTIEKGAAYIITGARTLIITRFTNVVVVVVIVVVIKCRRWDGPGKASIVALYGSMACLPGFNSGKERLIPRCLCTTRLAVHNTNFMGITVIGQLDLAIALFAHQGTALCCSACGGIRDSNERQPSTEDQGRGARAARRARVEGVAHLVRMIANGRHDEVRAINSHHTALCEP